MTLQPNLSTWFLGFTSCALISVSSWWQRDWKGFYYLCSSHYLAKVLKVMKFTIYHLDCHLGKPDLNNKVHNSNFCLSVRKLSPCLFLMRLKQRVSLETLREGGCFKIILTYIKEKKTFLGTFTFFKISVCLNWINFCPFSVCLNLNLA